MKVGLLVVAGCLGVSLSRPVPAAPRFTLEYAAPLGCPSREVFVEAVRARVPDAEESALEGSVAFRVTIEAEGELVRGRVQLGGGAEREVVPAPCADVASSMALMIAIVLSGDARAQESERAPETVPQAPEATPEPATPNETPATPPAPSAPIAAAAQPATPPADAKSERVSFQAGVWGTAGLAGGVAPFPAVALNGGAELSLDLGGWLRPSARGGVMYATGDTTVAGRGSAEFRASGFAARLCPHTFSLSPRWSLAACASLDLGELTARGVSTPNGREQRMPWRAVGVAPRVELALARFVSLESELGLRGIMRHDRFVFAPDGAEVYDVPRFAPQLTLGLSARYP